MTTIVDQKHRAVIPFKPGDVLEIEQPSPDMVVLKRTKLGPRNGRSTRVARVSIRSSAEKTQNQTLKLESNRRVAKLCSALQRERNPAKIREIKTRLSQEFYYGDRAR